MKSKRGDIIGEEYEVIKKIGAGSFGTIYLGKFLLLFWFFLAENIVSKQQVAIKAEPIDTKYPMVIYEANVTILL